MIGGPSPLFIMRQNVGPLTPSAVVASPIDKIFIVSIPFKSFHLRRCYILPEGQTHFLVLWGFYVVKTAHSLDVLSPCRESPQPLRAILSPVVDASDASPRASVA